VPKSLYVINAKAKGASYFGAEVFAHFGFPHAQGIADLAAVTVAALAPPDWDISVCDEHLSPIDFDHPAAYIGITGKVTQAARMLEIAAEFRRRSKKVLMGGPCVSLSPELFRDHCDILVTGELETIAAELFDDLEGGSWNTEYTGGRANLELSPMPRWDLYPTERALSGCVQTSRGCPFECEFCDVIQYLGRQQRIKPIAQILAELDVLYQYGFRTVFLADDNFTVYRRQAKEILAALRDWNRNRLAGPVAFNTQVSIDAARDTELLEMLCSAGMRNVFIGIETPNQESLKESRKRQNLGVDLLAQVRRFLEHGISVTGGMIVGFDHDGPDIFARQFEFAMESPIPIFSLGALVAPAATPLYERMRVAGRLVPGGPEVAASPWDTNIVPASMSRQELLEGLRRLSHELYKPANFERRVLQMIDALPPLPMVPEAGPAALARRIESEAMLVIKRVTEHGPAERQMMARVVRKMQKKPSARKPVLQALLRYAQVRYLYDSEAPANMNGAGNGLHPAGVPASH
jgi:Radical SAM superfamily/Domain of unknown function (DUF4070)